MISAGRNVKIWIFLTMCSLLAWIAYWVPSSIDRFFGMDGTPWDVILQNIGLMFMVMEMSGAIGGLVRFAGVIFGILSLILLTVYGKRFLEIKKWIVSAFLSESVYYFLLLPSALFLLGVGNDFAGRNSLSLLLGIDYLLLVLFTAPFLLMLAIKVYKYDGGAKGFRSWKWVGVTFVGYIASLWANSVIKWFDMIAAEGFSLFFTGIRSLGAINAFVLMSLAVLFAIFGAFSLAKHKFGSVFKWFGMTFLLVGLHYLIYLFYSYLVSMERFLMLAEIWAIPLLGLGLAMLKNRGNQTNYINY